MAGFEQAQKKAQLQRRRSERRSRMAPPERREGSYFPKLAEEEEDDMTLKLTERFMEEDEDMEAVFRSRPKIGASPLPSPIKDWENSEF